VTAELLQDAVDALVNVTASLDSFAFHERMTSMMNMRVKNPMGNMKATRVGMVICLWVRW